MKEKSRKETEKEKVERGENRKEIVEERSEKKKGERRNESISLHNTSTNYPHQAHFFKT